MAQDRGTDPAQGARLAGETLRTAAESHGENSRNAGLEALTGVLDALASTNRGIAAIARETQARADKLAETTIEAEANLR